MIITPVEITDIDWSPYGRLLPLNGEAAHVGTTTRWEGADYVSYETNQALLDTVGTLGRTTSSALPCMISQLERHLHTEEAQIPVAEPIVLLVGQANEEVPTAAQLKAVIVRPGMVFVLARGVWHSASHGLNRSEPYLWQAWVYPNEPSLWREIPDGPLQLQQAAKEK